MSFKFSKKRKNREFLDSIELGVNGIPVFDKWIDDPDIDFNLKKNGKTAIELAIFYCQKYMLDKLVKKIGMLDDNLIHWAAGLGNANSIDMLYEHGLDVNFRNKHNDTPLHRGVIAGSLKTVQKLIELGADIEAVNSDNKTAFDIACGTGKSKDIANFIKESLTQKQEKEIMDLVIQDNGSQKDNVMRL